MDRSATACKPGRRISGCGARPSGFRAHPEASRHLAPMVSRLARLLESRARRAGAVVGLAVEAAEVLGEAGSVELVAASEEEGEASAGQAANAGVRVEMGHSLGIAPIAGAKAFMGICRCNGRARPPMPSHFR